MRDSHIRSARFLEFARLDFWNSRGSISGIRSARLRLHLARPASPRPAGCTSPGRLRLAKPLAVALVLAAAAPAAGHHVGAYVPRDNELSANYKQLKFSIQARKFDVAARLFEGGAIRVEMRAQAGRFPAGLEEATRGALVAGDGSRAERGLMVFFAALIRDLALETDRRLADTREPAADRVSTGLKLLEAIWRYYNLVDFTVGQYDPKAAVAVRLAFDEAEGYAQGSTAPAGDQAGNTIAPESRRVTARPVAAPAPEKMREPVQRIARSLSGLIETSMTR